MTNIASKIIERFGGAPKVAEIVGTERTAVYKWTYPRERGGSDGLIPSKYHAILLRAAKERKLKLKPEDFFDL
jgi:putative alpha-1,2-mannosidase